MREPDDMAKALRRSVETRAYRAARLLNEANDALHAAEVENREAFAALDALDDAEGKTSE